MHLTATQCRQAKPKEKPYGLTDGAGLLLEVQPSGKKYWRFKYRYGGRQPRISLGVYPEVGLQEARQERERFRLLLRQGQDPAQYRRMQKLQQQIKTENTFEAIGREWWQSRLESWHPKTADAVLYRLEKDVFPAIGKLPITDLTAQEVLVVVREIEKRGALVLAKRALQYIGRIFRYAIITSRAEYDPTYRLAEALKPTQVQHLAAIEVEELPEFVAKLRSNQARLFRPTVLAVEFLMLTFVRTTEMIQATWDEIDLEQGRWLIPAERMKMRKDHIVPLSRQSVSILQELHSTATHRQFVFPHFSDPRKHMSNNTVLKALERLGYRGRMTGHGFRALAMSTIKEKLGYRHEVIDRQLAHQPRSSVDKAYDRAQFIDERRVMMQEWADYIDRVVAQYRETA